MGDDLLVASWKKLSETPGIFRNTSYASTKRRPLGWLGTVVQFNEKHLFTKRPASTPASDPRVCRPVDGAAFNFAKASGNERLLRFVTRRCGAARIVWCAATGDVGAPTSDENEDEHTLFVNVNPLVNMHCLLVPNFPRSIDPQQLTVPRLEAALHFASLCGRSDIRLGFNSLAAWATVNHIHWHVGLFGELFEGGCMPIERASRTVLAARGDLSLELVTGWPLRCVLFVAASTTLSRLARVAGVLTEELAARNIAHNVLVAQQGRHVYVIPRHPQQGAAGEGVLNAALLEVCGLAIVHVPEHYESLTADTYRSLLAQVSLSEEHFAAVREKALQLLEELQ